MQFYPYQTSMLTLNFKAFFIVMLGFGLMQIDYQLIIKLLISCLSLIELSL